MNTTVLTMERQLVDLVTTANAMMACARYGARVDQVVRDNLTHIWEVAQELQRRMVEPAVIAGYRTDALAQVGRVMELIVESGDAPDDMQMTSIGYACDLAKERIRTYLNMAAIEGRRGAPAAQKQEG